MKIVLLYSGGLDSFIMYHYAKATHPDAEISCVYYRHGAESEEVEIAGLPDFVEVKTVDWLNDKCRPVAKANESASGAIYIPGRNLVFTVLAATQYLPDEVWMGVLFDEDNPGATDKNSTFREKTDDVVSYALSPFIPNGVKLLYPFVEQGWSKKDIVKWALENGIDKEYILRTTSCWHNTGTQCGTCKQCFKRHLVMAYNGIDDSGTYMVHPMESPRTGEFLRYYADDPTIEYGEVSRLITDYFSKVTKDSHLYKHWVLKEKGTDA